MATMPAGYNQYGCGWVNFDTKLRKFLNLFNQAESDRQPVFSLAPVNWSRPGQFAHEPAHRRHKVAPQI
jgi:hypothetical protein